MKKQRKSNHTDFLTEGQMAKLLAAMKQSRNGHRDYVWALIAYRHGLRAAEACSLQWADIDLAKGRLHVRRLKHGVDSVHPLQGDEVRTLRQLQREQEPASKFVFVSERGDPIGPNMMGKAIRAAGERAGLPPVHPHMLRHSCGYALANAGHDTRRLQHWLGHSSIGNTVRYTALSDSAFKDFWR